MSHSIRRIFALLLTLAVSAAPCLLASPVETSHIHGRVFAPDFRTPVPNLAVEAYTKVSAEPVAKAVSDEKGRFELPGLRHGEYMLVLRDASGTALAAAPVATEAGRPAELTLALPAVRPGEQPVAPAATGGGSWLSTPIGATVALVLTATLVAVAADELTDDDPEREDLDPPSPDAP